MNTIKFTYDYFLHPEKDGNLSLATTEERIKDAERFFNNGDIINIEGNVAASADELRQILQNHRPQKHIVTIHGYTGDFKITPSIEVYKDGLKVGEVPYQGVFEYETTQECVLQFKCYFRSAIIRVKPGDTITLSFNKTTGVLNAQSSSGVKSTAKDDMTNLVYGMAALVLGAILGFVALYKTDTIDSFGGSIQEQNTASTLTILSIVSFIASVFFFIRLFTKR